PLALGIFLLIFLHYHFALCTFQTHTHTQAQDHYLALPILTRTRTLYFLFCALDTSSTRSLFTSHFPPGHRHCQNHCTLYNRVRPFPVPGNTLCEYVLPMCMYMCSPYVY